MAARIKQLSKALELALAHRVQFNQKIVSLNGKLQDMAKIMIKKDGIISQKDEIINEKEEIIREKEESMQLKDEETEGLHVYIDDLENQIEEEQNKEQTDSNYPGKKMSTQVMQRMEAL